MVKDQISMAITKGAPDYPNEFDKKLYKKVLESGNAKKWSEVPLPAIGTSYALLSCDKYNIRANVYYGDTEKEFSKGVGQYTGSSLFGYGKQILIGGHDTTYFSGIGHVKKGAEFDVKTNYGSYRYRVTGTKVANANDSSAYATDSDKEQMILYTCYPFGKVTSSRIKRYYVYCDRIDNNPVIASNENKNQTNVSDKKRGTGK